MLHSKTCFLPGEQIFWSKYEFIHFCPELLLSVKSKLFCNLMSVNTETDSLFYLNDHFIDNTLTHFLEVIETRVARKRTEQ